VDRGDIEVKVRMVPSMIQGAAARRVSKQGASEGVSFLSRLNRQWRCLSGLPGANLFGAGTLFGDNAETKDADVVVIGGGSGGISCANELGRKGKRVVLFDYVSSSTQGSSWGFGGTCVNVGCIPKKLMHDASCLRADARHDAQAFGLDNIIDTTSDDPVDWETLRSTVQSYIKSLNFSYTVGLNENVQLIRSKASFCQPEEGKGVSSVRYIDPLSQEEKTLHAREAAVVAVGGRPALPSEKECPGARDYGVTSDDIFSLERAPGKTLCVGASYVSTEVAGALGNLGFDTTLAVRSKILRGDAFDEQCATKVGEMLVANGIDVRMKASPLRIEKQETGLSVTLQQGDNVIEEKFDTVFFGTGRKACVKDLNLDSVGIQVNSSTNKIIVDRSSFQTTNHNIYCIGDAADTELPELTPVAIRQGECVANEICKSVDRNLFETVNDQNIHEKSLMVPSTVFTPVEYGRIGYSETAAQRVFGKDDIETYLVEWQSLALSAIHRKGANGAEYPLQCLAKLVCQRSKNERVVGLHYVGPHAGELLQGFALAVNLGATKQDFTDRVLGIHPTDAEAFTDIRVSRSSGEDFVQSGGCGGGRCG